MNIIHIFGAAIILIGGADHFVAENSTSSKALDEQKGTLLRKLQNFQEPKDETKPLTWNEILADVLVNRIKIFSFNKVDKDGEIIKNVPQDNILIKFFSQVLLVYKNNVYDKFLARNDPLKFKRDNNEIPFIDEVEDKTTSDLNVRVPGDTPKDDVELIEPRYHGKQICTNCNETEDDDEKEVRTAGDCGEGSVRGEDGNCVISKFILAIPYHCPAGYKRDRLGYCRMSF